MKLKKYAIQLLSGSCLAVLTILTLVMARYGHQMPSSSLLAQASIVVALGMHTQRTS